jgi:hypothetical protein
MVFRSSTLSDGQIILNDGPVFREFPPQTFPQLLDHNDPSSPTFEQRYWVNTRHYKSRGPVIVIDGGETSGEDRLPFLDTGIADILAKATNGLGVVLEHRYYGTSSVSFFSREASIDCNTLAQVNLSRS